MQDQQNNESLEIKNHQVLQVFKYSFLKDFNFFKSNLPLFIILPSILGGIWQILELSSIDLSYIRFFSINQIVPDGLLALFLLFWFFGLYNLIRFLPYPKLDFDNDEFKETSFISIVFFNFIPLMAIILAYNYIYKFNYNSFFSILINSFLLAVIVFIILGIIKQIDAYISHKNNFIKKVFLHYDFRKIMFIIFVIFLSLPAFQMVKAARELVSIPTNLNNFNKATNKLSKEYKLNSHPKLLYFSKDYLFYEIKIGNKKMIEIVETKNLFSDDSKKSKDE
ncbi:hypothetical protein MWMV17_MWMV17_03456 [Acinetobacter calcoaceticus]|uniref:Uncharacterized protein n=1 Tax=Acinetobacter calcoaceticus DSM 30006 = CIP 81.8 TaxID=981331 RepID=A0ABP2UCG4_ACICA|nr:hypothetical protein [Acinetobacter calcoaceticus]ENV97604.1 hypothetical protein F936_03245 [Acinetobacter calcoaceticus DSM 30006 = CIP 81.8]CAI3162858.1 hypothetical protein MWMV17_MWMV17_03456 [Acinetobacter calcoaceticus]SUU52031.1 Uncharacterised protein [Acinetobacter calcoaceticus]